MSLELIGSKSQIVYIAFSIVVITEDNSDIEWGSIQMTGQTVSSGSYYSNYTLTKFNLSKSEPYIQFFHEWLVGNMNHNPVWTNYWSSLY